MSAAAKRHLQKIHTLRCVVCWEKYGRVVPCAEAHHLEFVRGAHSPWATVPLCKDCHNGMHENRRRAFYLAHKLSDLKLLSWTIRELMA